MDDGSSNSGENSGSKKDLKYNLRTSSIIARLNSQQPLPNGATADDDLEPRLRIKPAPLSKYRRRTANARERSRMQLMSETLEQLRRMVPLEIHGNEELKPTKINTLRLAINYIKVLREILGYEPGEKVPSSSESPEIQTDSTDSVGLNALRDKMECDINNNEVASTECAEAEIDKVPVDKKDSDDSIGDAIDPELDKILQDMDMDHDVSMTSPSPATTAPTTTKSYSALSMLLTKPPLSVDELLQTSPYVTRLSPSASERSLTSSEDGDQRVGGALELLDGERLDCDFSDVLLQDVKAESLLELPSAAVFCSQPTAS